MVMKPDPKIKAQMVLFNWIRHRKGLSNKDEVPPFIQTKN